MFIPMVSFGQNKRELAHQNVLQLKEGALLVRLYTSESKINALKKLGQEKEAEEVIRNQMLENRAIYTSFSAIYDFSKVYFFYNTSSDQILKKEFKGNLLNEKLEVDSLIDIDSEHYFIAEFDFTPSTGLYALVIKDSEFEFLKKPFPYYVKRYDVLPIARRSPFDMVHILNNKLHQKLNKILK